MSNEIVMIIHKIKGINHGEIHIPVENGLFGIIGRNGSGKSTIINCLANLLPRWEYYQFEQEDFTEESYIEYNYKGMNNVFWPKDKTWEFFPDKKGSRIKFLGMTEGSLFYGYRLIDSRNVDELKRNNKIEPSDIADSDQFIPEKLGSILHDDPGHYKNIKRIRNSKIARRLKLNNTPYFLEINGELISQYKMSSGECLLISLLHFVYNSIERSSIPKRERIMLLIDEIELALHPVAIANLMNFLKDLCKKNENLTVIVTSHSPEVIRSINPNNMFYIDRHFNRDNDFHVETPIYPSYAIRDLYRHDGFDYLLLVEDDLSKKVVNKIINDVKLRSSKLIHVLPVGGWRNVLALQKDILDNNVLGIGKSVISILDGDVVSVAEKDYPNSPKLFLPIKSVEKYLIDVIIVNKNWKIFKLINDMFFMVSSLNELVRKYEENEDCSRQQLKEKFVPDSDGKRFYRQFLKSLEARKISEESFVDKLCEIIENEVDFTGFQKKLEKILI